MSMTEEQLREYLETQGVGKKEIDVAVSAMKANEQATGFQAVRQTLFPSGEPGADVNFQNPFSDTETIEYTDPSTGAIRRAEGVLVDPTATPKTGVYFDPSSTAPGSQSWLEDAANWKEGKVQKWRERLIGLGYEIPKSGAFDLTFRAALDAYHKNKYFYGKVLPLNSTDGAGADKAAVTDAYDPVEVRNDIRSTYSEVMGDEPTPAELQRWEKVISKTVGKVLAKGGTATHARYRAQEKFANRFTNDPEAKEFMRAAEEDEENTALRDSLLSVAQIVSG